MSGINCLSCTFSLNVLCVSMFVRWAVILAFDVRVEREAQEMADSLGVRIFSADIIYHLFDAFLKHRKVGCSTNHHYTCNSNYGFVCVCVCAGTS